MDPFEIQDTFVDSFAFNGPRGMNAIVEQEKSLTEKIIHNIPFSIPVASVSRLSLAHMKGEKNDVLFK